MVRAPAWRGLAARKAKLTLYERRYVRKVLPDYLSEWGGTPAVEVPREPWDHDKYDDWRAECEWLRAVKICRLLLPSERVEVQARVKEIRRTRYATMSVAGDLAILLADEIDAALRESE